MKRWTRMNGVTVFGAPVFVHWSVYAVLVGLCFLAFESPIDAFLCIASYLSIITVHEYGHAYVARRHGSHVESIHIGLIHGVCEYEAPYHEWDDVKIAWGGVAAQLCLAIPVLLISALLGDHEIHHFGPIMVFLGYINLWVALMNLIPAQGLDGKRAWRVIPLVLQRWQTKRSTAKLLRSVSKRR